MTSASSSTIGVGLENEWTCWKCGSLNKLLFFFCPACNSVVDPRFIRHRDYFELFNETRSFDLDLKRISRRFKELQMTLHPDKAVRLSQVEQDFAQELSSLINKAYRTLQRPLERGLYLLELNGKPLDEGASVHMDATFLAEMMETNEELSEMETFTELRAIDEQNKATMEKLLARVSEAFSRGEIEGARMLLAQLKYFVNIDDKIRKLELN